MPEPEILPYVEPVSLGCPFLRCANTPCTRPVSCPCAAGRRTLPARRFGDPRRPCLSAPRCAARGTRTTPGCPQLPVRTLFPALLSTRPYSSTNSTTPSNNGLSPSFWHHPERARAQFARDHRHSNLSGTVGAYRCHAGVVHVHRHELVGVLHAVCRQYGNVEPDGL